MAIRLRLETVRISFPFLFEAKEYEPGDGKFRYSASFFVDPNRKFGVIEPDKVIRRRITIDEAIREVAADKFLKKADAFLKQWAGNSQKFCWIDGTLKTYDVPEGEWVLAAHRRQADGLPTVLDQYSKPVSADSGIIYAGCYVHSSVEIYAQAGQNPGIRCGLSGVMFAKDGDAFGGGRPSDPKEFEDLSTVGDGADLV